MLDTEQPDTTHIDSDPSHKHLLVCAWCGPVMVVLLAGGMLFAGLWPPPRPSASAAEIQQFYLSGTLRIRLGLALMMGGVALIIPWGAAIADMTRRITPSSSLMTMIQIGSFSVSTLIAIASIIGWGLASFRPDDVDPQLTRGFSDLGWFWFVFDWSPLFVWYMAVALAIFADRSLSPVFPRWSAYLSVWVALGSVPGGAMILFKTGPLAFNGVFAIWIPFAVFTVWIFVFSGLLIRGINRQQEPNPHEDLLNG